MSMDRLGSECSTPRRPVLTGYSVEKKCLYVYQPPCKKWSCPECSRRNRAQWSVRISSGVDTYKARGVGGWAHVTMTLHPKLRNRDQCLHVWPSAWSKLSARLRRQYPKIRYCLLPELHGNGRVHVHMIASGGVETRWLKDNAPSCGLGHQHKSEELTDTLGAAFYVTKYLAKSLTIDTWPKNLRRIRTSQKWPPLVDIPEFDREDIDWYFYCVYDAEYLSGLAALIELEKDYPVYLL